MTGDDRSSRLADKPSSSRPRWSSVGNVLQGLRTALINILFIMLVLILIPIVSIDFANGLRPTSILIEQITAPEKYIKKGYSSEVLSSRFVEEMQDIFRRAYSYERGAHLYPGSGQPDVQLPGTGMSVHGISRYIQSIIGMTQRTISGTIVEDPNPVLQIRLVRRNTTPTYIRVEFNDSDKDAIRKALQSAADQTVKTLEPRLHALYQISIGSPDAMEEVKSIMVAFDRNDAWYYYFRGYIAGESGKVKEAIELYDTTLAMDARIIDALADKGTILSGIWRSGEAIDLYSRILKTNPANALIRTNLAQIQININAFDRARENLELAVQSDPDYVLAHSALAQILYKTKHIDEGAAKFRQLKEKFPESPIVSLYWGYSLEETDDPDALAKYRDAILLSPKYFEARIALAAFLLVHGENERDRAEANEIFSDVSKQFPSNWRVWDSWGMALIRNMEIKPAIEKFQTGLRFAPGNVYLRIKLATGYVYDSRSTDALRELDDILGSDPLHPEAHYIKALAHRAKPSPDNAAADESLRQAQALAPEYRGFYDEFANFLYELRGADAAVSAFQRASELEPDNAQRIDSLGVVLFNARQFDKAAEAYIRAINKEPSNADYHAHLAMALRELGRTEDAIAEYRKASELEPENAQRASILGDLLFDAGQFDKAADAYTKAINRAPRSADYHASRAAALLELKNSGKAVDDYKKASELDPKNPIRFIALGDALYGKNDFVKAAKAYADAVSLDPENAALHANLGNALRRQGNYAAAAVSYRDAVRLNPTNAAAHNYLGLALRGLDAGSQEARDEYRKAIELDANFSAPYYNLARALADKPAGAADRTEACRLLQEGARVDPTNQLFAEETARVCR